MSQNKKEKVIMMACIKKNACQKKKKLLHLIPRQTNVEGQFKNKRIKKQHESTQVSILNLLYGL